MKLDLPGKRVEIRLGWTSEAKAPCPKCGKACGGYDYAPEKTWRHLDTMQFQTVIQARTPRVECPTDGVKTIVVPWAEPHGRFSRLFERFAIDALHCARSWTQALLGLSWDEVHHIVRRAVARGLGRQEPDGLQYLGIDEMNFGAGQSYISVLTDLEQSRVLEVVEERTSTAAEALWDTLSEKQRGQIEAVAVDMWEPFPQAALNRAPQAAVVHDKFHIAIHLNEAEDQVGRKEQKELLAQRDATLTGTRQLWLYNPQNFTAEQAAEFATLRDSGWKAARAWAAKDLLARNWSYRYEGSARKFLADWFGWASRSRLQPLT